ncbi:ALS2 C-terminal-like protein isoform X2 [Bombina bombina]|uniref:ALS2 C-terminal-like protein isoform X2 n=1 Tax=Bombina bombina TaxID=8345 RepID=UPI00235B2A23|nr:ALS2 C-terminal-like protein isoform X2 [Bombina bombina]
MSKSNISVTRRLARRHVPSLMGTRLSLDSSIIKDIFRKSVESLLLNYEEFLAALSKMNSLVLNTLLQADADDPVGKEHLKLLLILNEKFHTLWDLTTTGYNTLKQDYDNSSLDVQDFYFIQNENIFLTGYTQYFVAVTNYMVVKGFDRAAKNSSHWKTYKKNLKQLVRESNEIPTAILLLRVFTDPVKHYVEQCSLIFSQLNRTLLEVTEEELVTDSLNMFVKLKTYISQSLDEASLTKSLWNSLSNRLTYALCIAERRLQEDSRNIPIAVTTGRYDRVLLFDDVLVFLQGNEVHRFDLQTVWLDSTAKQKSDPNNLVLRIITPEEEFFISAKDPQHQVLWLWKLNQLIRQRVNGNRDLPLWGGTGEANDPPTCRLCTYTYKNDGRFKNAVYEGEMSWGKPHGKGRLKWPDGRNHAGDFKFGQENGFGVCLMPNSSEDQYDCYKCHWRDGAMQGYGICEYADEFVYKGYFKDNMRHGFGILESPVTNTNPYKYTGNWECDKKSGYGIWESTDRGERYIGMWQDNQRHGPGVVLTHSGACYQGVFNSNKLVGTGILLSEDNTVYEGEFTEELILAGKGKLTLSNGFTLVGTFYKNTTSGVQTQGILHTSCKQQDETQQNKLQFGVGIFPVETRWQGIYEQFQKFLESGCKGETEEAFLGFHVRSSKKMQKSQDYLYCERATEEISGRIEDIMKDISLHQGREGIQCYLEKAFNSSRHPFKKLLKILAVVFQAAYSGIGANLHLLTMAQEEIKYYAKRIWEFYRDLMRTAAQQTGQTFSIVNNNIDYDDEDEETRDLNSYTLILPLILPRFHPDLFMLHMLYYQEEDALYWQGIVRLGLLTDTKLLEFLDVQKSLWPLRDVKLTSNQRFSIIRHKCFHSATECLQKIISTMDPSEKLQIILKTLEEIEKTVSRVMEKDYKLPMDDLLPLLIYVVSRAEIQHLGAEIHFIRGLMDPHNMGGIYDFSLTALEACYEHIKKEEVRHYKAPAL